MEKSKNSYTEEEKYWCSGGNTGTLPTRITSSEKGLQGRSYAIPTMEGLENHQGHLRL